MSSYVDRTSLHRQLGEILRRLRRLEASPGVGTYEIKVFADGGSGSDVVTGDGAFIFEFPDDLDRMELNHARAFVTTVSSSGLVTVQLRNITQAVDMLSTKITIDAGETSSGTAATPPVINVANAIPDARDLIAIDVDTAGTGAKGLGVILRFGTG